MNVKLLGLVPALLLVACADAFPIPAEFDAAFTVGQVCAPARVQAGVGLTYPVRFDLCLYRCITIDRTTAQVRSVYQCAAGQCQMTLLATAHAKRVDTEVGCDARDLVNPPDGQCTTESLAFNVSVPDFAGEPAEGDFVVTIPYLELEEGQKVIDRIDAGENPATVIQEEVGPKTYPQRQFAVNFSTTHPTTPALTDADCHPITAP